MRRKGETTVPTCPGGALSKPGVNPARNNSRLGISSVVLNFAFVKLRTNPPLVASPMYGIRSQTLITTNCGKRSVSEPQLRLVSRKKCLTSVCKGLPVEVEHKVSHHFLAASKAIIEIHRGVRSIKKDTKRPTISCESAEIIFISEETGDS